MNSFFSVKEAPKKRKSENKKSEIAEAYTEETWEQIVQRILYLCRMRNMNLNVLALRSGLTPSTLKSIMYGTSKNPSIVTLRHICDGLDISLEEFFHSRLFRKLDHYVGF